ncbi:MAG: exodeoxyribonuclease VII small subunit [Alphaproteobacteria bacterium]
MYDFVSMTFEKALREMEELINLMENPQTTLEEAILAYEKGASLKHFCEGELKKARLRVSQINVTKDDQLDLQPFDMALRGGTA